MGSELVVAEVAEDHEEQRPEWVGADEPWFPTMAHQELYRETWDQILAEAQPAAAMFTATKIMAQKIARDHVVGLIADQGETKAINRERDRRMLSNLKLLSDNVGKANNSAALHERFVIGLIGEIMGVIDSRIGHEPVLAGRVKEDIGTAALTFTEQAVRRLR